MGIFSERTKDGVAKLMFMTGIFVAATASKGDWLLVLAFLQRLWDADKKDNSRIFETETFLERWKLKDFHIYVPLAILSSFVMYYGICWGLQWYFYINRRHLSKEWKCQPEKFLTPANEKHEILLGSLNMLIGSTFSGFIACYIMNGGHTTLYFEVSDYGVPYLITSAILFFLYVEALAYYCHRATHFPFLYKNIHKVHHRYKQPTAFSAVAMHPLEFLLHQSYLAVVPFVFRLHAAAYIGMLLYTYYYGLMDHSGVKMEALWPWQPNTTFHDNHHEFFHCNFGFNSYLFDWFHGTLRRKDRQYGEDVFGGFGRDLDTKQTTTKKR